MTTAVQPPRSPTASRRSRGDRVDVGTLDVHRTFTGPRREAKATTSRRADCRIPTGASRSSRCEPTSTCGSTASTTTGITASARLVLVDWLTNSMRRSASSLRWPPRCEPRPTRSTGGQVDDRACGPRPPTPGRRLGQRNINRHYVPDPQDVDLGNEEGAFHTMVTAWSGDVWAKSFGGSGTTARSATRRTSTGLTRPRD